MALKRFLRSIFMTGVNEELDDIKSTLLQVSQKALPKLI